MARKRRRIEGQLLLDFNVSDQALSETPVRPPKFFQVDTEGRRGRFGSPPPPPGASPSLLIPTPGRHITKTASDLILAVNEDHDEEAIMPLRAPLFQVDKNSGSYAAEGDTIKLVKWCFKLVPIKQSITLSERSSTLSHWIIVCGIKSKASAQLDQATLEEELWHSSCIVERKSPNIVSTASGSAYELVGPCNSNISESKRTSGYLCLFDDLVPDNWVDVVCAEATKRNMLRSGSDVCTGKQRNKIRAAKRRENRRVFRDLSPLIASPPRAIKGVEKVHVSPENAADVAKRAIKLSHKSIPRELRQLQASKLGNLATVQAAIMEGLEGDLPKRSHLQVECETDSNTKLQRRSLAENNRNVNAETPRRSSTRARNTVSEWWKVDARSSGKRSDPRLKSPVMKLCKGKRSQEDVFESDDGPTEDEYQQSGMSSDSDHTAWKCGSHLSQNVQIQPLSKASVPQKSKTATTRGLNVKQQSKNASRKQTRSIEHFFIRSSPTPRAVESKLEGIDSLPALNTTKSLLPSSPIIGPAAPAHPEALMQEANFHHQRSDLVDASSGKITAAVEKDEADPVDDTVKIQQESLPHSVPPHHDVILDDTFYFSD